MTQRTPTDCPDAPECDCLLCPKCAEWEHSQGWHADEYVDVCPACAARARTPEEIAARGAKGGER